VTVHCAPAASTIDVAGGMVVPLAEAGACVGDELFDVAGWDVLVDEPDCGVPALLACGVPVDVTVCEGAEAGVAAPLADAPDDVGEFSLLAEAAVPEPPPPPPHADNM
jgi:hypothetical protein